ncbi:MAG: PEGA domain-containing protein [Myxococcales bacterium]|nr:PEGA domain-containing protein [Myxococcales bacterium]
MTKCASRWAGRPKRVLCRRWVCGVQTLLWLIALVWTMPAMARRVGPEKAPQPERPERELQQRVEAALGQSDFALAHRLLDESYRQAPQPEKLYLLATLAQAEGRALDAMDLLRRVVADPGSASDVAQMAAQKLQAMPTLLHGEVLVQGERGAVLTVDDRPVGVLPLPASLWLAPGLHKLATSVGARRQEEVYRVMASRTAELRFDLSSDVVVATLRPAVLLLIAPSRGAGQGGAADPLSDEETQALEQAVTRAATEKQLGVQGQAAALQTAPQHASCLSELRCQLALAEANQATLLLLFHVEATNRSGSDRALKLKLEALEPSVTARAAQAERVCTGCTPSTVGDEAMALTSQVLHEALARPRGLLSLRSQPEGAEVLLDGNVLGQTPLTRKVWAGSHSLLLRKQGFVPLARELSLSAGQLQTLDLTLSVGRSEPLRQITITEGSPSERPAKGQRPRWRILTGASSVVAGAVMIGFGISALAVNSRCVSGLGDASAQCKTVYDTTVPGATLTSVGGATLLTGTMLLVWPP